MSNSKLKTPLLAMVSFLLLQSCGTIMKKMYGIKNPEIENEQTIKKKALKYDLDTSNIVTVHSQSTVSTISAHGIPNAAIYDGNGKYMEYRQSDTSCNAGLFQFIPDLKLTNSYNKPDSLDLKSELAKYRDLKGNSLGELRKADFYLVIYWAVWTGKLNKDHVKIWEDLAKNNKNCKIEVIKVNLDFQEYWNLKNTEKVVVRMNNKKKKR
ncbi:MAG: hypothetical protein ACO1N0_06330 [Fluviicola sp.]